MKNLLLTSFFALLLSGSSFGQNGNNRCWILVSAGKDFTLAIKSDGTLWGWGVNVNQLGLGFAGNQSSPTQIGTDNDWMTISAGDDHALAIKTAGTLWSWGDGTFGQLGNGAFATATANVTQVGTGSNWAAVSAGTGFSLALQTNGRLYTWGKNNVGQLANNTTINTNVPGLILPTVTWSKIDAGHQHSLAILNTGTLFAWGDNTFGQFGNSTNTGSLFPLNIAAASGFLDISAGFDHSMILNANGSLFTAGNNTTGQLCNNSNVASNIFGMITLINGAVTPFLKISAGYGHSMVIDTNSQLWTGGENTSGELGLNNFTSTNFLTQVGTNTNWWQISAGSDHSEILENNADLWSAGLNLQGQLGIGSNSNSNAIVQVACPTTLANASFSNNDLQVIATPNPTTGIVKINFNLQNLSKATIKLTNTQGQLLFETNTESTTGLQSQDIDLSNQNSGLYFVTINSDNGSFTSKIIKN